ncbi:hypothetical protein ABIA33_000943 [Streptacidiphilus sp. MAP12-16]|uniref:DUF4231 domain-containing protein n=1 Tax=Streptacidiphilus sp. MAP12-16 TaxID=3156300 RepID=UPI0035155107
MPHQDPPRHREAELLPDPFWAADRASLQGQDFALHWYRWQLGLTLLAALFGVLSAREVDGINIVPLLSIACFLAAGAFALALHRRAPQEQWYQGRSAAESVKTLTWKYVVRARPFEGPAESALADKQFEEQVRDVPQVFRDTTALPSGTEPKITRRMRVERRASLRQRRELYLTERVYAQRTWYLSRADECDHKSHVWGLWIAVMFGAGILFSVLEATAYPSLRALGLFSAGAATVTAWTQLRQFRPLASAYRLAGNELERIARQLNRLDLNAPGAEADWARLARDAEEAISREHIVWRARSQHRV